MTEVGEIQNRGECKLCWFCAKFSLDPGQEEIPGYSELTPGSPGFPARMFCADGHFEDEDDITLVRQAEQCPGFKWSPAIKRAGRATPRGGCGARLALPNNAYWEFCGQIRHLDQAWPPLCKECGGGYERKGQKGAGDDRMASSHRRR